jgi:hypothetical protein
MTSTSSKPGIGAATIHRHKRNILSRPPRFYYSKDLKINRVPNDHESL